jgi:phospholipid/cholesterol/gamma-HCH transport system permease protein
MHAPLLPPAGGALTSWTVTARFIYHTVSNHVPPVPGGSDTAAHPAMSHDTPRRSIHMQVEVTRQNGTLVAALVGEWAFEGSRPSFDSVVPAAADGTPLRVIAFDTDRLGSWDSSLLTFLHQGMNYCEANGVEFRDEGLPANVVGLLGLARAVPEKQLEPAPPRAPFLSRLGTGGLAIYDDALASVSFVGEVAQSVAGLAGRRVRMRWRDFWVVVQANGAGALPIVTLISFLIGLIIAFLGAVVLRRFGAGYYVSYLVGYGMLREMAALMTGIIMAGRTGAAFAAELGSMKITEEIDAYRTLGLSPVDHLVLPRVLGIFVMMPLLTIYAMFVGIAGGLLVAVTVLDLTVIQFLTGLLAPVRLSDALLGVFKGSVFGLIIGIAGCMRGMQTGSDAGAVGRSATSAVVTGITLIIMANAIIDWIATLVGV